MEQALIVYRSSPDPVKELNDLLRLGKTVKLAVPIHVSSSSTYPEWGAVLVIVEDKEDRK